MGAAITDRKKNKTPWIYRKNFSRKYKGLRKWQD